MADREELLRLADRVEALEYFACPMCGWGDFDIPGFSLHAFNGCVVDAAAQMAHDNAAVAASLRARAQAPLRAHGGGE